MRATMVLLSLLLPAIGGFFQCQAGEADVKAANAMTTAIESILAKPKKPEDLRAKAVSALFQCSAAYAFFAKNPQISSNATLRYRIIGSLYRQVALNLSSTWNAQDLEVAVDRYRQIGIDGFPKNDGPEKRKALLQFLGMCRNFSEPERIEEALFWLETVE